MNISSGTKSVRSEIIFVIFLSFLISLIFISCDKEVSRSPVESEPSKGKLVVSSDPGNYLIFLNGKNTGRYTPDSLTFLDDGTYEITLKKKYFKDTSVVVTIYIEEKQEIFIDYLNNPSMYGKLSLFSIPPGGNIFLNDSLLMAITPDTIEGILPGEYIVKIKLQNHRDAVLEVNVQSSTVTSYSTALRDTSEWVDFQTFNSSIPSNSLTTIDIDGNNIKWVGSTDKGLIKYDEVNFTSYSTINSGIPSNIVNSVTIAPDNKIWVGTTAGLAVFDGTSWIVYDMNNSGLTANQINSVEFDQTGNAWIGCSAGLFKFDGANWTRYNNPQSSLWVLDTKIVNNTIWIGTSRDGIYSMENEILTHFPDSIYLYPSINVSSAESDILGNIWFTHTPDSNRRSGVSYFNGSSFTSFVFGSVNVAVNHITTDNLNNKWISSYDGLLKYDASNNSKFYTISNSLLSSNRITATVMDEDGVLWITTSGGGLNKFKPGNL
ncbi:MAG: PEGA domain-containing protein [Ignavibacteriaceae bacterium]